MCLDVNTITRVRSSRDGLEGVGVAFEGSLTAAEPREVAPGGIRVTTSIRAILVVLRVGGRAARASGISGVAARLGARSPNEVYNNTNEDDEDHGADTNDENIGIDVVHSGLEMRGAHDCGCLVIPAAG